MISRIRVAGYRVQGARCRNKVSSSLYLAPCNLYLLLAPLRMVLTPVRRHLFDVDFGEVGAGKVFR
jgi:hypothetical protein